MKNTKTETKKDPVCPGAKSALRGWCHLTVGPRPALSRYGHGKICPACGRNEALTGDFIQDALSGAVPI